MPGVRRADFIGAGQSVERPKVGRVAVSCGVCRFLAAPARVYP